MWQGRLGLKGVGAIATSCLVGLAFHRQKERKSAVSFCYFSFPAEREGLKSGMGLW